jgi:Flp pilus assembly protein TadG
MRRTLKATGRRYERGSVAVEAALVLPVLLVFMGLPSIFLASYYRQYSAAQKAVHDAALYLATAPKVEITTSGPDGNFAALTVARKIIEKEMAGIVPDDVPVNPTVICSYMVSGTAMNKACTPTLTKNASYTLRQLDVSVIFNFVNPMTGSETDLLISPYVPVRYVGD